MSTQNTQVYTIIREETHYTPEARAAAAENRAAAKQEA